MCNYCHLQNIRRRAKKKGSRVYLRAGMMGGTDVFVVPKGEKLDISVNEKGEHSGQWVAWMMEIPDHCVC